MPAAAAGRAATPLVGPSPRRPLRRRRNHHAKPPRTDVPAAACRWCRAACASAAAPHLRRIGFTIAWDAGRAAGGEAPCGERLESRPIASHARRVGHDVDDGGGRAAETRLTDDADRRNAVCRQADRMGRGPLLHGARRADDRQSRRSKASRPRASARRRPTVSSGAADRPAAVASEGTINLIWDPNTEADLAGYLVLRAGGRQRPDAGHARADHREHVQRHRAVRRELYLRDPGRRQRRQRQRPSARGRGASR